MMKKKTFLALLVVTPAALLLFACSALRTASPLAVTHPQELEPGRPVCTECHENGDGSVDFRRFNHTVSWGGDLRSEDHRFAAYQQEMVCNMCHDQSFCNDCHATRVELKPSIRRQADTYRRMPHRGNWLSRHRLEGEIDPTPCFRCHGNPKSSQTCAKCHGRPAN